MSRTKSQLSALASRFEKHANPWKLKPSVWLAELRMALAALGLDLSDIDHDLVKIMWAEAKDPTLAASDIAETIIGNTEPLPMEEPEAPFTIEADFKDAVMKIATNFREEFQEWLEGFKMSLAEQGMDARDIDLLEIHRLFRSNLSPYEAALEVVSPHGSAEMPAAEEGFFSKLFR